MIYSIKKKNESNERLISRFKKIIQRSRMIPDAKKSKYHHPSVTKREVRVAALIRETHRARRAKEQFYS